MPTFPTYHGPPLPEVLNPLNPLHYLTVLKWVYFQPNRLKYYLHQADPDLYRARGGRAMLTTLRRPAYRNLYVIALITSLLATVGVVFLASAAQATPVDWGSLVRAWAFGVALYVAVSVLGGGANGVAFGVAFGVTVSVAFSVLIGVLGGVAFGAPSGVAFGVAFGVTVSVAFSVLGSVAFGVVIGVLGGVALCVLGVVTSGVVSGAAVGVTLAIGASRLIFYPFELGWVWLLQRFTHSPERRLLRHPTVWDELVVWPFPGLARDLQQQLTTDFDQAVVLLFNMLANSFQLWNLQRAVSDWLATQVDALAALYRLTSAPPFQDYFAPPAEDTEFHDFPSALMVLLGEIAQMDRDSAHTTEYWVWRLTRRLRRTQPTPVSGLAEVLYDLAWLETNYEELDIAEIKLPERFAANYEAVRTMPHGAEIAGSFELLDAALNAQTVIDVAVIGPAAAWLSEVGDAPLRPAIVEACRALVDISARIAVAQRTTNLNRQGTALNLAAGALQELLGYIEANVVTPERVLFKRAVQHWQSLVAQAQGQLGQTTLHQMSPQLRQASGLDAARQSAAWAHPLLPLDNPYVVGNPVTGSLFVGRAAILNRIGEVWSAKAHPDSIILYGHRRMGKSSLLRNLDQVARPDTAIVYVDLLGETSLVNSTADLLLGLANKVYAVVRRANPATVLTPPDGAAYTSTGRAQIEFDRLTEQVRDVLQTRSVILALDEFEAVEKAIGTDKIDVGIYRFLRTKTQDPLFTFVLGGLHTLDEMSRDYQHSFYGSYDNIRVSYLSHDEAWQLITNPTPDFELDYEPVAVEHIIAETGGQPYLVQKICRDAIDHLNHELFDEHLTRDVLITLADVGAVLDGDLFNRGTVYFDGVWSQTTDDDQRAALRVLACRAEPWTIDEVRSASGLTMEAARESLRWAAKHDILRSAADGTTGWEYCVPLMRRWVCEKQ